jgi:hypothetical protein
MAEETTTQVKKPKTHLNWAVSAIICSFIFGRPAIVLLFFLILSFIALYYALKTRNLNKSSDPESAELAVKTSKKALVLGVLINVVLLLVFIALVVIGAREPVRQELNALYRRNMMTNLYARLEAYQSKFGTYPNDGEGVRALYPLYKEGFISRKELESILQPPGVEFDKFSEKPTEQEFDAFHIGWSYNANARPGSEDPLIGYQGIKDGKLHLLTTNRSIMPLSERDAFIILANGRQLRLPTKVRTGELLVPDYKISLDCLKD